MNDDIYGHFKSYDELIPKIGNNELLSNENEKKIKILSDGFTESADEIRKNITELYDKLSDDEWKKQLSHFNDTINQHQRDINSIRNSMGELISKNTQIDPKELDELKEKLSTPDNSLSEEFTEMKHKLEDEISYLKDSIKDINNKINDYVNDIKNVNSVIDGKINEVYEYINTNKPLNTEKVNIDTSKINEVVEDVLKEKSSQFYLQDTIGKPDYALCLNGAQIVKHKLYTSQTYNPKQDTFSKLVSSFGLSEKQNPPEIVIHVYLKIYYSHSIQLEIVGHLKEELVILQLNLMKH